MAANVETYATEKDGSLQSSDAARVTSAGVGAARNLDQHRRDALARVDEAAFSSAQFSFLFYFFDHVDNIFIIFSQLVPREGLLCRWRGILHRCVSGTVQSPYLCCPLN